MLAGFARSDSQSRPPLKIVDPPMHYYYFINFVMTIMTNICPPTKAPGHLPVYTEYWKYVPTVILLLLVFHHPLTLSL